MDRIRVAAIGCGGRSHLLGEFIKAGKGALSIVAAYDPLRERALAWRESLGQPSCRVCETAEEAIAAPDVDLVCIFSPNASHSAYIIAALAAGKRVFSEKPLATTLEDCQRIREAEKNARHKVMTGFVLRYAPIYRKVKELLASGTFGNIVSLAASENRESWATGSMSSSEGWRRFRSLSGPYLLEKCSHDLDLINWYAGALPEEVFGYGGLDYFIPANKGLWDKYDHDVFAKLVPLETRINPFLSEKDIFDNNMVLMKYPGGMKASFQLTLANAIPERRMYIGCTEGTIVAECFSGTIRYRRYGDEDVTLLNFTGGGHGGGDPVMAREIVGGLLDDKPSGVSGVENGYGCALVALAADESMRTGRAVRIQG